MIWCRKNRSFRPSPDASACLSPVQTCMSYNSAQTECHLTPHVASPYMWHGGMLVWLLHLRLICYKPQWSPHFSVPTLEFYRWSASIIQKVSRFTKFLIFLHATLLGTASYLGSFHWEGDVRVWMINWTSNSKIWYNQLNVLMRPWQPLIVSSSHVAN
jgi:hypothetical protein